MLGWGLIVVVMTTAAAASRKGSRHVVPERPPLVTKALARQEPLYYFGLGSNMLRSKLENRGVNGSKIDIVSMQPALVPGYRLAFNMRGFAPLEPGMGSLEPVNSKSRPLAAYEKPECHGALCLLTPENYEKVMASEGVSFNSTNAGYEEIVVTAIPYDGSKPVLAIALRARPHVRLKSDPSPSKRYMKILREGAAELELRPCYRAFLDKHPVQEVPVWLRGLAIRNLIAVFTVSSKLKWRGLSKLQSFLIFRFYAPSTAHPVRRAVSDVASGTILLPGALVGAAIQVYCKKTQKSLPPFLERFIARLEASERTERRQQDDKPTVEATEASSVR